MYLKPIEFEAANLPPIELNVRNTTPKPIHIMQMPSYKNKKESKKLDKLKKPTQANKRFSLNLDTMEQQIVKLPSL